MLDTGCTANFINAEFIDRHGIKTLALEPPRPATLFDNSHINSITHISVPLIIERNCKKFQIQFYVTRTPKQEITLGAPFFAATNPILNWNEKTVTWQDVLNADFFEEFPDLGLSHELNSDFSSQSHLSKLISPDYQIMSKNSLKFLRKKKLINYRKADLGT